MNREELISEISKKTKVSKKDAGLILSATIETIEKSVKKGDKVTLVGFGTFLKNTEKQEKAETHKQEKN